MLVLGLSGMISKVCVLHVPGTRAPFRTSSPGDDVLFRLRLAFEKDEATLKKLIPGCEVCPSCSGRAMRSLVAVFGKHTFKAKIAARKNEYFDRQRREQEEQQVYMYVCICV